MAQEDFLYDAQWIAEINKKFIELLTVEDRNGNFRISVNHVEALTGAMNEVNSFFERSFIYGECFRKMRKLQMRYTMFCFMLNRTGVYYDVAINGMHYDNQVWASIVEKYHVFAFAYATYGDPKCEDLKTLFEDPQNGPNVVDDMINILSNDGGDDGANPGANNV